MIKSIDQKSISLIALSTSFVLLTIGQSSLGQSTKAYKGSFNTEKFNGSANYLYFENESQERIYNGNFSFKTSDNVVQIAGNYLQGKKHGKWSTSCLYNGNNFKYGFKSLSVIGVYENGNLTGKWVLKEVSLQYSTTYLYDLYFGKNSGSGIKSSPTTEICIANFSNNKFSGYLEHKITGKYSTRVFGKFDDQGYFDSTWTISYQENGIIYNIYREYNNGYLISIRKKDTSSGDIFTLYDSNKGEGDYYLYDPNSVGFNFFMENEGYNLLKNAIFTWFNDTNGSALYEVKRGANFLDTFPERKVTRQ